VKPLGSARLRRNLIVMCSRAIVEIYDLEAFWGTANRCLAQLFAARGDFRRFAPPWIGLPSPPCPVRTNQRPLEAVPPTLCVLVFHLARSRGYG